MRGALLFRFLRQVFVHEPASYFWSNISSIKRSIRERGLEVESLFSLSVHSQWQKLIIQSWLALPLYVENSGLPVTLSLLLWGIAFSYKSFVNIGKSKNNSTYIASDEVFPSKSPENDGARWEELSLTQIASPWRIDFQKRTTEKCEIISDDTGSIIETFVKDFAYTTANCA